MSEGASGRLGFPRAMRIKHGRDFSRLRRQGQRIAYRSVIANWIELPADKTSRLGVITTKALGPAVVRSRARRLLRETFRLHQNELRVPLELVLVARNSIVEKKLPDVESDFLKIMRQAGMLKS
ncbi:MAG: ribonuclease P protein component [Verrucomicrobia bacterium]|nr:ribonuclease P protein component [Verrucomicrobiota bacterium]